MKCPKCDYLGFDTGVRCRNCGYDFSLSRPASRPEEADADLLLRPPDEVATKAPVWDGAFEPGLPLFSPDHDEADDQPLVTLPLAPRPPIAVRKTPQVPRLREVSRRERMPEVEPGLQFADDAQTQAVPEASAAVEPAPLRRVEPAALVARFEVSRPGPRLAAAAIDHLILAVVDLTVLYLTVRMAGLSMGEWRDLPLLPLGAFLVVLKLAYFFAFTAVGGQTIGKMVARIRVVSSDGAPVDAVAAVARSCAGTVSVGLLGMGYVPALIGAERLALHDRFAHTRVVALPPL